MTSTFGHILQYSCYENIDYFEFSLYFLEFGWKNSTFWVENKLDILIF
jgi:hypothetical protein